MSCGRSGFRKLVTEAKVGPLELRRKREAGKHTLGEGLGERHKHTSQRAALLKNF